MHSPTAVRMMVEPIDRPANAASPDMADDGCVDKDEGRFGDELAEGRQGQRHDPAVGGAGVGRAVADVCVCAGMRGAEAIAACSIAGTGGFASEESMGTLTRISRLTALRKHLLWARNVIPDYPLSYPQYVDNLVDYPQNYPQNVDNLFFYPHFAFCVSWR